MPNMIQRTIRLPIVRPQDAEWKELRTVAQLAARFGNLALSDQYTALANGLSAEHLNAVKNAAFKRMNDELSSYVRDAMMQNRVKGFWRRAKTNVLRGRERVACFSETGALTIRADEHGPGVLFEREGEHYVLACRLRPIEIRDEKRKLVGRREPLRLVVWHDAPGARKDWYLRDALAAIWSRTWKVGAVTFRLNPQRRTLEALVSYSFPAAAAQLEGIGATLSDWNPETNEVWLRFDGNERSVNYADRLARMVEFKAKHEEITHRLRRKMGNGKGGRRRYKLRLARIGNFAQWARDRMHELSADIVTKLRNAGVAELRLGVLGEGDLPWYTLRQQLAYKCEQAGIRIVEPADDPATLREKKAKVAKQAKRIKRAKVGLQAAREIIDDVA